MQQIDGILSGLTFQYRPASHSVQNRLHWLQSLALDALCQVVIMSVIETDYGILCAYLYFPIRRKSPIVACYLDNLC